MRSIWSRLFSSRASALFAGRPKPARPEERLLNWISIDEFMKFLAKQSDLIVVDLRSEARHESFPVPLDAMLLPVEAYELTDVLESLPPDRAVVFHGVSDLSILMIEASSRMKGAAPVYILDIVAGDLASLEAA